MGRRNFATAVEIALATQAQTDNRFIDAGQIRPEAGVEAPSSESSVDRPGSAATAETPSLQIEGLAEATEYTRTPGTEGNDVLQVTTDLETPKPEPITEVATAAMDEVLELMNAAQSFLDRNKVSNMGSCFDNSNANAQLPCLVRRGRGNVFQSTAASSIFGKF